MFENIGANHEVMPAHLTEIVPVEIHLPERGRAEARQQEVLFISEGHRTATLLQAFAKNTVPTAQIHGPTVRAQADATGLDPAHSIHRLKTVESLVIAVSREALQQLG